MDTWSTLAADDNWWEYVSHEYADSCQANSGNGYFNYLNDGTTYGYDWYEINGGRQDYMNYFRYCREFTLELSDDKTPDPNDLPTLWDANYPSLLNYIEQSLFGLRGIVTDSITGNPLKAKVEISNHDIDSSHVYSNLPIGNYNRYLHQGNYDVTFSKSGYHSKTINVSVLNNTTTIEDVQLVPLNFVGIEDKNVRIRVSKSIDILGRKNNKGKNKLLFNIESISALFINPFTGEYVPSAICNVSIKQSSSTIIFSAAAALIFFTLIVSPIAIPELFRPRPSILIMPFPSSDG